MFEAILHIPAPGRATLTLNFILNFGMSYSFKSLSHNCCFFKTKANLRVLAAVAFHLESIIPLCFYRVCSIKSAAHLNALDGIREIR